MIVVLSKTQRQTNALQLHRTMTTLRKLVHRFALSDVFCIKVRPWSIQNLEYLVFMQKQLIPSTYRKRRDQNAAKLQQGCHSI